MDSNRRTSFLPAILLGCLWFGSQMGASAATGATMKVFFMSYGWTALPLFVIALLVEYWYTYWAMELARVSGQHDFGLWMREMLFPFDKIGGLIFDVLCIAIYPILTATTTAGCAEIFVKYLDWNYTVSLIFVSVLYVFLAVIGVKILSSFSTFMSAIMVAITLFVLALGLAKGIPATAAVLADHTMPEGKTMSGAIWTAILFMSSSTCTIIALPKACEGQLRSSSDTKRVILVGGALLMVFFIGMTVVLFQGYPDILGASMPMLSLLDIFQSPFLNGAYPILLFAAFTTTGPVFIYNQTNRWSSVKAWNKLSDDSILKKNMLARNLVVGILFLALTYFYSTFGFQFVIQTLLRNQAILWIPVFFLPLCLWVPVRVKKMHRELAETGHVTTVVEYRLAEKMKQDQ
jgi:uncharacterized membrane protein YkvI